MKKQKRLSVIFRIFIFLLLFTLPSGKSFGLSKVYSTTKTSCACTQNQSPSWWILTKNLFIRGHTREFSRTITYTDNQGLKINFVFLKEDLWKIDAHKNRITQTVHPRYPEKTEWYWKQSGRQGPPLLPQQLKDNDLLWVKSFREALKYAPPEIDKVMKQYDMAYPTIIE